MAQQKGYGQFCPVSRVAEILAERWTPLVVRELICGSHRFNDLQRGVPRMSSALLSRRLKALEYAGIVERRPLAKGRGWEYHLTAAGRPLGDQSKSENRSTDHGGTLRHHHPRRRQRRLRRLGRRP